MQPTTEQSYNERILRVLVHIQQHLDEALDLKMLARVACFSPYHFHRIFRGLVGESVAEHVRRLRLERAAYRLKHGDQPVTRLAFEAGYETHEAFTRAFGRLFDCSPSEFRKQHQPVAMPTAASSVHYAADGSVAGIEAPATGDKLMDVTIKQMEPVRVAFVRHVGPYDEVPGVWSKLMAWAGPRGLLGQAMTMIGVCHDDPDVTPTGKVRYDACLKVGDHVEAEGDVGIQDIPGGPYAVATHRGPYEMLGETYAALCGQWLPAGGRELRHSPGFEIYRNSPQFTPPEELLTDIHLPLEPR